MKWFDRFSLIMRMSVTSLREKIEDPERMLHQLIVDMEEELDRVKKSVAEAIADEILLRKRVVAERETVRRWMDRATSALEGGDEEKARAALERKVDAERRAEALDGEHRKLKEQTTKLRRSVEDLEEKIRKARQKKTLLVARMVRASSEQKIHRAMSKASDRSAFAHFDRLERKVEHTEALAEAYDQLEGEEPESRDLESSFEEEERQERLRSELDALRKRVRPDG